jgi:hypothetical protein
MIFSLQRKKIARHLNAGGQVSYANIIHQTISEMKAFSGPVLKFADLTTDLP